jgi:uncharacterized protein
MKPLILLAASLVASASIPWSAHAASFDCAKAGTSVERQICADKKLSAMDDKLDKVYREALATGPKPELLRSVQRDWLKDTRNVCANRQCLVDAYQSRLDDFLAPGKTSTRR